MSPRKAREGMWLGTLRMKTPLPPAAPSKEEAKSSRKGSWRRTLPAASPEEKVPLLLRSPKEMTPKT